MKVPIPGFEAFDLAFDIADVVVRVGPMVAALLKGKMPGTKEVEAARSALSQIAEDVKGDADETFFASLLEDLRAKSEDLARNIDKIAGGGFTDGEYEALRVALYTHFVLREKKPEGREECMRLLEALGRKDDPDDLTAVAGMRKFCQDKKWFAKLDAKAKKDAKTKEVMDKLAGWGAKIKIEAPQYFAKVVDPTKQTLEDLDDYLTTPDPATGQTKLDWLKEWSKG